MTHPRHFRFGVQLTETLPGRTWGETARHVESLGYSTLFLPDHFGDQLAPIAALSMAAEATTTLRVGALVFGNDYRHPVTVASEMATLDLLSTGRVEFGLGAGWMMSDYGRSGISLDRPGIRIDRMEEAIQIIKSMFTGVPFDFAGEHYQLEGMAGRPIPYSPDGPPLIIGGGGKRVLSVAGREADIVGINPNMKAGVVGVEAAHDALPESIDQKVEWVKAAAGDRFDDIELNVLAFVASVTDDAASMANGLAEIFGSDPASLLEAPAVVVGTERHIEEQLLARRERWGFSYYVFQAAVTDLMAPVVARMTGK